jgi:hypothetical protein
MEKITEVGAVYNEVWPARFVCTEIRAVVEIFTDTLLSDHQILTLVLYAPPSKRDGELLYPDEKDTPSMML